MQKAKLDFLNKKKKDFENAKTDKLILGSMVTQYNSHISNVKNYKCIKAKQENIQTKATKFKKLKEKDEQNKIMIENKKEEENLKNLELKKQMEDLEIMEEKALEAYKKTLQNKEKELAQLNISNRLNYGVKGSSVPHLDNGQMDLSKYSNLLDENNILNLDLSSPNLKQTKSQRKISLVNKLKDL
jgi:hypothetical protein